MTKSTSTMTCTTGASGFDGELCRADHFAQRIGEAVRCTPIVHLFIALQRSAQLISLWAVNIKADPHVDAHTPQRR